MLHVILAQAQPIIAGSFDWPDITLHFNFLLPVALMAFAIAWYRGRGLHR